MKWGIYTRHVRGNAWILRYSAFTPLEALQHALLLENRNIHVAIGLVS